MWANCILPEAKKINDRPQSAPSVISDLIFQRSSTANENSILDKIIGKCIECENTICKFHIYLYKCSLCTKITYNADYRLSKNKLFINCNKCIFKCNRCDTIIDRYVYKCQKTGEIVCSSCNVDGFDDILSAIEMDDIYILNKHSIDIQNKITTLNINNAYSQS